MVARHHRRVPQRQGAATHRPVRRAHPPARRHPGRAGRPGHRAGPGGGTAPRHARRAPPGARRRCRGSCRPTSSASPAGRASWPSWTNCSASASKRSAVVIAAIAGTAGVGKTTLAVRWAHRVAGRFPDGQLYVDLRGYDPEQPVGPSAARSRPSCGRWAWPRWTCPPTWPSGPPATAPCWRTAGCWWCWTTHAPPTRCARCCPASRSCMVLVTSRDDLAGLVVRDGARRVDLDILTEGEAVALLRTLVGARIDADPIAAAALAAAVRPAAAGPADRGGDGHRAPGRADRRAGGRPRRRAAPARSARRDRRPAHRGTGGLLLVVPAPVRRRGPRVRACSACTRGVTSTSTRPARARRHRSRSGAATWWTSWPGRT